ncbi:MAG: bifunctional nuclease family protein [Symbiobacteriaceae bacterium]|nr:MAG: bifunctional nuclease family protein [Bacillota bacterium]
MVGVDLMSVAMIEETGSVVLVLRAAALKRLLVMEVGLPEGRAIALEVEGIRTPRPLTHELTLRVMEALGATLNRVVICDFRDRTFFANLELTTADGRELKIDSRPSDALALALRLKVPILAEEKVLEEAGVDEQELSARQVRIQLPENDDEGEPVLH